MTEPLASNFPDLLDDIVRRCTSCGGCVRACDFLRRTGSPAALARQGGEDDATLLRAYECSLCGLCDALCPLRLSPSTLFLSMRREAVKKGRVDAKTYRSRLTYEKLGGALPFRRYALPPGCTTVFFPGCSLPGSRPHAVLSLLAALRRSDPAAGLVLDCCGKISHDLGYGESFERISASLRRRLHGSGVRRILTACPGCDLMLRKLGEDFEVRSLYEVLTEGDADPAPAPNRGTVAVHDPCPSRFDPKRQQAVRELIRRAGYAIEELPEHGRTTLCCGQGGMVEGVRPGTLDREAARIADQAQGRLIVSSCAACVNALNRRAEACHVADLLGDEALPSRRPLSSARRWLNRLRLRLTRLP
ncbi:MAG: (Fe-S)-binding protein [Trichloromonas sp.]|jgi:Fe-S oxidoreductase|nr:(Fe-S)-binding protein [Trichloromonas sp.]